MYVQVLDSRDCAQWGLTDAAKEAKVLHSQQAALTPWFCTAKRFAY